MDTPDSSSLRRAEPAVPQATRAPRGWLINPASPSPPSLTQWVRRGRGDLRFQQVPGGAGAAGPGPPAKGRRPEGPTAAAPL